MKSLLLAIGRGTAADRRGRARWTRKRARTCAAWSRRRRWFANDSELGYRHRRAIDGRRNITSAGSTVAHPKLDLAAVLIAETLALMATADMPDRLLLSCGQTMTERGKAVTQIGKRLQEIGAKASSPSS